MQLYYLGFISRSLHVSGTCCTHHQEYNSAVGSHWYNIYALDRSVQATLTFVYLKAKYKISYGRKLVSSFFTTEYLTRSCILFFHLIITKLHFSRSHVKRLHGLPARNSKFCYESASGLYQRKNPSFS
jgi:hypothetical protein